MEKTKHSLKAIKPQSFTFLWASIQAFGWGLIYILLTNIPISYDAGFQEIIVYAFIGVMVGGLTGALQMVLVEQSSGRHLRNWVALTTGAYALAFVAIQFLMNTSFYYNLSPYLALAPLFVLPALAQWWSLRDHSHSSWMWIAAHGIADLVFIMILLSGREDNILAIVFPAALQGILTGFTMFWLLERLPKPLSDNLAKMRYHEVMES